MFSYLCVRMPALVSCSDFGERDTVAVKAVGHFFFQGGWLDGMKERARAPIAERAKGSA